MGNIALRYVAPGKTERDLTLSNGVDVRKILPAGPGSYEPEDLWQRTRSPHQNQHDLMLMSGTSPLSSTGGRSSRSPAHHSNRRSPSRSPQAAEDEDGSFLPAARPPPVIGSRAKLVSSSSRRTAVPDTIGPGYYDVDGTASMNSTMPKLKLSTARSGAGASRGSARGGGGGGCSFGGVKRESNNPLPRPPALSDEERAQLTPVGAGKPGTCEPGLRGSPRRPVGRILANRGASIGSTPRTFNLSNPNSFTFRHRDADFNMPPPGWYNVSDAATRRGPGSRGTAFGTSPRRIDLARSTAAPGPGTYFADDIVAS